MDVRNILQRIEDDAMRLAASGWTVNVFTNEQDGIVGVFAEAEKGKASLHIREQFEGADHGASD